jgi:hypothetical protein
VLLIPILLQETAIQEQKRGCPTTETITNYVGLKNDWSDHGHEYEYDSFFSMPPLSQLLHTIEEGQTVASFVNELGAF